jgi:endothelin-converting enzyme/putative endopeptidase
MRLTRIVSFIWSLALAAGLALGVAGPAASSPPAPGPGPKGVEIGDVDRAADACTDFHAFANGAWRAANPIPAGQQRWSRRLATRAANREQLKALLGELAANADRPRGSVEQLLGDHFAACMDEPAIDAMGVAPLVPLLADINDVQDGAGVQRMIRRLHELAIPAPFVVTGASDYHDPARVIVNIAAGGLGLPDRDYYLGSEPRFAEAREKYRAHVAAVMALGGMAPAPAGKAAEEILALETRLAEASLAVAAAADPAATAHKVTFAQLRAGRFDWDRYFAEAGLLRADLNVAEPAFLERLDRELESTPVEVWKAYLTWHLLESASPWLARPFAEESFAFKDKYLGGAREMKPRATQCLESTEALLGEPLGRKYAERYFPPAAKSKVQEMVRGLRAVLQEEIGGLTWMAPATRQQMQAKLAAYDVKGGLSRLLGGHLVPRHSPGRVLGERRRGPEVPRRHRSPARRATREPRDLATAAVVTRRVHRRPAQPDGVAGRVPASAAFDLAASDAANYGAIGIGVAHDLTHAIDTLGADFDATGSAAELVDGARSRRLPEARPVLRRSVRRLLHRARGSSPGATGPGRGDRRSSRRARGVPGAGTVDAASPDPGDRRLQSRSNSSSCPGGSFRGAAESIELQRQLVKSDSHAISKYRVIGPLSNSPEFQQAFACPAGSAMVRLPERRCAVW